MAHKLNYNSDTNEYAFYSKKEKAWHGLGQVLDKDITPGGALNLAHMNYKVGITDVYAPVPELGVYDYINMTYKIVPNCRATYRTDTNEVFGSVGNRYEIVQNNEFLDFIYSTFCYKSIYSEQDIVIETAGALGKGERVFVTAKIPNYIKLRDSGDDVAERYLLITNNHDGKGMFTAGLTNVRVVCNNTLNFALNGNIKNKVTLKHTKSIHDNIERGQELLRLSAKYTETQCEAFTAMSKVRLLDREVEAYVARTMMSDTNFALYCDYGLNEPNLSARTINKIYAVLHWIQRGIGQTDVNIEGTVYWALQGIIGYINNAVKYESNLDRFDSINDGYGYNIVNKAYSNAIKYL